MVTVLDAEPVVVKSDVLMPAQLGASRREVAPRLLEEVPRHQQDWGPEAKNRVLHLVDPAHFPLNWGRTRMLFRPDSTEDLLDRLDLICEGKQTPAFEGSTFPSFRGMLVREGRDYFTKGWERYQ